VSADAKNLSTIATDRYDRNDTLRPSRRTMLLAGVGVVAAAGLAYRRRRPAPREVERTIPLQVHHDGAGVRLQRALGGPGLRDLDPFLLLDGFHSVDPADYVAGFPTHPHRGFETVTILFDGTMTHADSVGNAGTLRSGDVQWMTAGRGILHSEFPGGDAAGLLSGFQLWVNLPGRNKMMPPRYQDIGAADVPAVDLGDGRARVLAGTVGRTMGPVEGIVTEPTVLDVTLSPGATFDHTIAGGHTAFVQPHTGSLFVGDRPTRVRAGELAVLGPGERVSIRGEGRFLLIAAAPIGEPIARRGPFVMNTEAELEQAFADHRAGRIGG
jgi:redox-sensitive bicupin YhaK (pirin superfamily)